MALQTSPRAAMVEVSTASRGSAAPSDGLPTGAIVVAIILAFAGALPFAPRLVGSPTLVAFSSCCLDFAADAHAPSLTQSPHADTYRHLRIFS